MMDFDSAFDRLMGNEGGYVNDPQDPGGETQWGISKRSYPTLDIKALTRDEAKEIYRRDFWERGQMNAIDPAVAFQVFDFAVNSGIETAIRKLQAAAGVAEDGHIGPVTLEALRAMPAPKLIMRFVSQRLRFWAKLKAFDHDGRGWANRAAADLDYATQDF